MFSTLNRKVDVYSVKTLLHCLSGQTVGRHRLQSLYYIIKTTESKTRERFILKNSLMNPLRSISLFFLDVRAFRRYGILLWLFY